jgi:nitrogen fixation/metabolism regulation signal transduction histidine kinase
VKLPRMPGRFEWKILVALFIVASLPLGAAAYLMSVTIGRIQAVTEQHQEAVRQALGGAVEVYRSYFAQMKENFRDRGNEIASARITRASDLADVPDLLSARILEGNRVVDEWAQPAEVQARAHEAPPTIVPLAGSGAPGEEPRIAELTFGISTEIYANFLALREATEKEHDLDRVLPLILPRIVRGLGIALLFVLAFATVLGLFVARRATGRVAALRDAAQRVGAGDLSVRVAPRGNDELDELARAFDIMVAELGDARSRLGYLQKVSAWQEVARRLAHEIKNPLTPIQLAVQELASKYRGDDPVYRRLLATAQEILNEEVGAIRRLVDDFSAFAKLPKVEPAPVDLAQVVEDFARSHPEWQEYLKVERNGTVGALCDRMLLRNVLANLVENAVQAAAGVGRKPEIRIAVALSPLENGARLNIDDNGPGVPADARERIFDPYVTTKEHGTGLGLAIVRKIVLDHGGDVHVDGQPSPLGGARFVVTLPTAEGSRTTGPRAAAVDDRRPR